jgi:hypothetical protein
MRALHEPITLEQLQHSLTNLTQDQPSTEPSLKETLEWLNEKIPLGIARVTQADGSVVTVQAKAWSLDSCYITVGYESTLRSKAMTNWMGNAIRCR